MVRSELLEALCKKLPDHFKPRDVELAVNYMIKQMTEALELGERIEIRDFGSFSIRTRPARLARNPKTGESVTLPSKSVVHFKPGKQMKDRVNSALGKCSVKD